MGDQEYAVVVKNLYKTFKLPHEQHSGIKQAAVNIFNRNRGFEEQKVLNDISFDIKKGEFFAIVGRNGSGKSTLLKLLAGIYVPDKGLVQVNGSLTPFIELGVGFNPELTGRENVYMNGALLGFGRSEMDVMYDEIVGFAELEKFMDQKLKNYSSGMQVRLAFSIAIQAQSDILLLDEVLAVGDAAFQRKCFEYFGELKSKKQTVIFISHDMASVRKYCDRGILIDKGEIKLKGSTEEIINEYSKLFLETDLEGPTDEAINEIPLGMAPTGTIDRHQFKIDRLWLSINGKKVGRTLPSDVSGFQISMEVTALGKEEGFIPGIIVQNNFGEFVTATNSEWAINPQVFKTKKNGKVTLTFDLPNIYEEGDYKISANVVSSDSTVFYDWRNHDIRLHIDRKYQTGAKAYPQYKVRYE